MQNTIQIEYITHIKNSFYFVKYCSSQGYEEKQTFLSFLSILIKAWKSNKVDEFGRLPVGSDISD